MAGEERVQVDSLAIGGRAYWSVERVAQVLRVTPSHVRRLLRSGSIVGVRAGARWWCRSDSVREYEKRRGPWAPFGIYGGRDEAERQGLLPRREVA